MLGIPPLARRCSQFSEWGEANHGKEPKAGEKYQHVATAGRIFEVRGENPQNFQDLFFSHFFGFKSGGSVRHMYELLWPYQVLPIMEHLSPTATALTYSFF